MNFVFTKTIQLTRLLKYHPFPPFFSGSGRMRRWMTQHLQVNPDITIRITRERTNTLQKIFNAGPARVAAAEQQAVMQIVRDFCDHSNANCDDCLFPGLLRAVAVRE